NVSEVATFDGFETFLTNGYTFTFCTYTSKGSEKLPRRFAGLTGVAEKDTNGIPYITCPVNPGPSGTFAIPNALNSLPVLFISNNAFDGCSAIRHVILPETLQYIGPNAFYDCSELLDLFIPESVQEIDDHAFEGCSSLKSVQICSQPNDFRIGKEAFANCNSIENLVLPQGKFYLDTSAFKNAFATNAFPQGPVDVNSWHMGITETNLTTIAVSNGFRVARSFYEDLKHLNNHFSLYVDSGEIDEHGDVYIPHDAYRGLTNLHSVIIGPHIKWISGNAFAECPNLTNLVIQGKIELIGWNAFINSKNLYVDPFPFGKGLRNALMAFDPAVIRRAKNRALDSLSRTRLDCGLILALNTAKERNHFDREEFRNDWENSARDLHY
ncbi:MAG: leucine-rich repeat domain-containing protein, partial [Kiritimatiellae bacterium]|nr:leucine-rich repeat domain-containing protein [Kiritimatiellia bacterium]